MNLILELKTTCLLIIDMQNDFLAADGFFAKNGWDISRLRQTIPVVKKLKDSLPPEMLIVYTATGYDPLGGDSIPRLHKIVPNQLKENGVARITPILRRGSYGNQIVDELKPSDKDYVVTKRRFDAFYQTDLEMVLRTNGIKTVLFTGVVTEVCVETTLREAFVRDFDVVLVEDGCGSWDEQRQLGTCRAVEFSFGAVEGSDEIIRALGGTI